jgi:hypothetical protein
LKTASNAKTGDAAITIHNIQILTIKTIAKTNKGTNNTIAKNNFIIRSKKSQTTLYHGAGSAKSEKFNKELYIVINGHTNHLDFSKIFVNVYFILLSSEILSKNGSSFFTIQ